MKVRLDFGTIHNNLVYYLNDNGTHEGRICLFNSYARSVEKTARFYHHYKSYEVVTTEDKVNSYVRYFE